MKPKDFAPGEIVYCVERGRNNGRDTYEIQTRIVQKVGHKYVTAGKEGSLFFEQFSFVGNEDVLSADSYGFRAKLFLFPTEQEAKDFIEYQGLKEWFRDASDWTKIRQYSLEQLRAVKKILTEENAKKDK